MTIHHVPAEASREIATTNDVDAMFTEALHDVYEYQSGLDAARSSLPVASDASIAAFAPKDDALEHLHQALDTHRPLDGLRLRIDALRNNGVVRRVGTLIAIGSVAAPVALGVNMLVNAGDQVPTSRIAPVEAQTSTTLSEAGQTCIDNAVAVYEVDPDQDVGQLIAEAEACRSNDRYSAIPGVSDE